MKLTTSGEEMAESTFVRPPMSGEERAENVFMR
jgi:hypothetical protein